MTTFKMFRPGLLLLAVVVSGPTLAAESINRIDVWPAAVELQSRRSRVQVAVTGQRADGLVDVTRSCSIESLDTAVATVRNGRVVPIANGKTELLVRLENRRLRVPVTVSSFEKPDPIRFRYETLAALTKQGCNAGSCHGSPKGKGGFSLSLFAYSPAIDEEALIRDGLGRRTNPQDPQRSLMIRKPMLRIPHVGGKRLRKEDAAYEILTQWIAEGARTDPDGSPVLTRLEVHPSPSRVIDLRKSPLSDAKQQLSVLAHFSDGTVRDVTRIATFDTSDDETATVDADGLVTGHQPGQAAVSIRYLDHFQSVYFTVIRRDKNFAWTNPVEATYVDRHVHAKLKQMNVLPSGICSDDVFLRRVSLDLTGLLPTVEQTRLFLADQDGDKRTKLIDDLLKTDQFARHQAQRAADLMRINPELLPDGRAELFAEWIVEAVRTNKPFNEFTRDILTATGDTRETAPANYFLAVKSTEDLTETTAQVFMGSRINCAKCHNHPFENWTQDDYYSIGAVFARVQTQGDVVTLVDRGEQSHPATGQVLRPWGMKSDVDFRELTDDRREPFVSWLTDEANPFFARVEVNRLWAQLFGRGIVNPIDDFRSSNPPSNVELLDALATDFIRSGYDRQHIMRTICNSNTYQRSTLTNETNAEDEGLFSHQTPRLLSAEQLLDAIGNVTASLTPIDQILDDESRSRTELDNLLKQIAADRSEWEPAVVEESQKRSMRLYPWHSAGPFTAPSYEQVCEKSFIKGTRIDPAVPLPGAGIRWERQNGWSDGTTHKLKGNIAATYLFRQISSNEAAKATISLGTDDGCQVWLNGELVHDKLGRRGVKKGEDRISVELKSGANELLIKVCNSGGNYAFVFELLGTDGKAVGPSAVPAEVLDLAAIPEGQRTLEQTARLIAWKQDSSKLVQLLRNKVQTLASRSSYATQRAIPEQTDFLKAFGQPKRESPCTCERSSEPTLDQALQLLNGRTVLDRVNRSPQRFERFSDEKLVEELYLAALCRRPRKAEVQTASEYLARGDRSQSIRDLVWAVVNTQEFLLQH